MKKHDSLFSLILLTSLFAVMLYLCYPQLLLQPNSYLAGPGGDGYKNFATPLYHILYDSSYHHYGGMPYPYGDHVIFSDNQPLIANTLQFLNKHGFNTAPYTLAFINYSMLFSLLLCGIFLYLIWRKLGLPRWLAMFGSLAISFLSPQLIRFAGHYGLAHAFIIPCLMLLLLMYEEKERLRISLLIALLVMAAAMLHFYFFGICCLFIIAYQTIRGIRRKRVRWRWDVLNILVQIGIPLLVMSWWIFAGSDGLERPASPYGFLAYRAHWEGLLLPFDMPAGEWVSRHIIEVRQVGIEGYAYIGALAIAALLVMAIRSITKSGPVLTNHHAHQQFLINNTVAAFILLLFSMGLPFIIPPLEKLLPFTGPLQQFRGAGRFAWLFFYAINIYTIWYLLRFTKLISTAWIKRSVTVLLMALLIIDVYSYQKAHPLKGQLYEKLTSDLGLHDRGWLKYIDPADFQAILPIPFFHIGSENFWVEPQGKILEQTLTASLQSGLPSIGALMTRVPLQRSLAALELMYPLQAPPAILNDLPNQKPLLILLDKSVQPGQQYAQLLDEARFLYENEQLQFYALPLDYLENAASFRAAQLGSFLEKDKVFRKGDFMVTDSLATFVYNKYDNLDAGWGFQKTVLVTKKDKITVFDSSIEQLRDGKYFISFWYDLSGDLNPLAEITVQPGKRTDRHLIRQSLQSIENGWGLVEVPFDKKADEQNLLLSIDQHPSHRSEARIDELLIRSQQDSIFGDFEGRLFFNNRWFIK